MATKTLSAPTVSNAALVAAGFTRAQLNAAYARKGQILTKLAIVTTKEIGRGDVTKRAIESGDYGKLSAADKATMEVVAAFETFQRGADKLLKALGTWQKEGGKLAE